MNYKTLVAASLMSFALTSAAFAQCTDCAQYPDRDVLNGAPTPASKMMAQPDSAGASTANPENNGHAGARVAGTPHRHFHDSNASMGGGSFPAYSGAHGVYSKNLRDSGYNPADDFNAAGNVKVN